MFGIEDLEKRFFDYVWRTDRKLLDHNKKLVEQKDQLKSVQSTNDKRYNEIKEWQNNHLSEEHAEEEAPGLTDKTKRKFWGDDVVNCDKCKCLLYKEDAIRGESRIVNDGWHAGVLESLINLGNCGTRISITPNDTERIQQVYYCHKCGGKNEKVGNKKVGRPLGKTDKK